MLTPFENEWSTCDFFFYLSQPALTTLSHPLCITIISFLWGLVKSPHGIFSAIWGYLYHDMVFFNTPKMLCQATFMLSIAFLKNKSFFYEPFFLWKIHIFDYIEIRFKNLWESVRHPKDICPVQTQSRHRQLAYINNQWLDYSMYPQPKLFCSWVFDWTHPRIFSLFRIYCFYQYL